MRRLTSSAFVVVAIPALMVLPVASPPGHPSPHPVHAAVHRVGLSGVDEAALRDAGAPQGARSGRPYVLSAARATDSFATVGVTWSKAVGTGAVTAWVRTRTSGRWSDWQALDALDDDENAGATTRTGTSPLWVGPSDGVQARVDVAGGAAPRDVEVDLVDPGTSPADATLGSDGDPASTAHADTPVPPVITRAAWGADESLRKGPPSYADKVRVAFVHHTASTNNYTPDQAAAQVRGFYAYHTQTLGWNDIGYNFLVDRYGRVFEGRYGGIDRAVIGAHTGGYNTGTMGVAMIGDFTTSGPPAATLSALESLLAWKLSYDDVDPNGSTVLTSGGTSNSRYPEGAQVTLANISGHRDPDLTDCPGNAGYAALPTIRAAVTDIIRTQNVSHITSKHLALGGDTGWQGPATSSEAAVTGGRQQDFRSGTILWSPDARAHEVHGGILDKYRAMGQSGSVLGVPVTDETGAPGGRVSRFAGGLIAWGASSGSHEVHGAIDGEYEAIGGPEGPFGLPTSDETGVPGGSSSSLQNGVIFWSPSTSAHEVHGAILGKYQDKGGPGGFMGFPITDEVAVPGGRGSVFGVATVYWSPATAAHEIHGAIRQRYLALGGPGGFWGLPTSDETALVGGVRQTLTGGDMYWTSSTGTLEVHGAILGRYLQSGGAPVLGFPVGDERPAPGGSSQDFQRATITYDGTTGATTVVPR